MLNDLAIDTLSVAMRGLAQRQRAIADNIANQDTPNFLARKVDFESSLRQALATGRTPHVAQATEVPSAEPLRENGNNVRLDDEMVQAVETNLRYQLTIESINHKYRMLRTAIREGR